MKAPYVQFVRDYSKVNKNAPRCDVHLFWKKIGRGYRQMFHTFSYGKFIHTPFKFEQFVLSESAMETRLRKAKSYDVRLLNEEDILKLVADNFVELL